jgi:hypothetical protein
MMLVLYIRQVFNFLLMRILIVGPTRVEHGTEVRDIPGSCSPNASGKPENA